MTSAYPLPLSAVELLAEAQRITGIDIEDKEAVEPLTVLVNSCNQDARMHEAGALRMQTKLLRILCNRLRMLRDFAAHPEIAEQKIQAPIFLAGSVRTGSTKVHRLLTASGDFNWLPFWQCLNSALYTGRPDEDVSARIQDTEDFVKDFSATSPRVAATHEFGALIAEEETFIFLQSLYCSGFHAFGNVTSYQEWFARQDTGKPYRYLVDTLKYLQWQGLADPAKHWLLKSPHHCGMESVLTEFFPDATMMFTHRPPVEFMPSICSLLAAFIECHSDYTAVDSHALVTGYANSLEKHIAFRKAHPEFPVHDINYKDATNNVRKTIEHIYRFLDEPLRHEALERMLKWDRNNPIHKHGKHRYTLEDFDLTAAEINSQCKNYLEFYEQQFGR